MAKNYRIDVMASVHQTAADLYSVDGMDRKTMHKFDLLCLTPIENMTPERIRALRDREKASQTVFAAYLNVTPGLVSKWERGEKILRALHSNFCSWWRKRTRDDRLKAVARFLWLPSAHHV
jgi:putative transcriptional regulator